MHSTTRVQGILNDIVSELKVHRDSISKSSPELVGAFEGLILRIETEAKNIELSDAHYYVDTFTTIVRMVALCIDIMKLAG